MTMPLVRVPLTLAAALAFHVVMSPPAARTASSASGPYTEDGDRHAKICTAARFATAMLTKGLFWASAFTDTFALLAPYCTSISLPTSISIPPKETFVAWLSPSLPSLPLVAIAGTTLALTGALLRSAAYDALGQFYPCPNPRPSGPCNTPRGRDQGRRKGKGTQQGHGHAHALITTGPYAVVRHPGYAGLVLCTTGLVVLHLDVHGMHPAPGTGAGAGWSSDSGLGWSGASAWGVTMSAATMSAGMRAVALGCAILCTVGALRRIREEERVLRAKFKGEWEEWAKQVRYQLIPGVY